MKKLLLILFIGLSCLLQAQNAPERPDNKQVKVTYVGNAGFLIHMGDKKILIDALFKGSADTYELPLHIREKLKLARAPFDNVDLILVTHAHGDHFHPGMVNEHMKHNSRAVFASTRQAADMLPGLSNRSVIFDPSKGKSHKRKIRDFSIESFLLPHGPNSKVINIGFLVSVNGVTVFQTGDADFEQFTFEEFRSLQLPEKKIDLSFIQHYYLTADPSSRRFVAKGIGGKYIFPIHYHFTTPAFDPSIVKRNYPYAIIFKEELQSWEMPDKKIFPVLKGDYLGQPLPGETPEVFAPGIVSTDSTIEHGAPAFSPDGNEVFWQSNFRQKGKQTKISGMTMKRISGQWSAPGISPFDSCQVYSLDGKRLFYVSAEKEKAGVRFVEKQGGIWSKPTPLGLIDRFPELKYIYMLSFTRSGTIYFMGHAERLNTMHHFGIYRAEFVDGAYVKPELLPPVINAPKGELNWCPFIAPDESFLLFSSNRLNSQQDLFISFRRADGTWTEAYNLGPAVNTTRGERFPSLTPDGKYLFFTRWVYRDNEDVYWVSAKIIDKLREKIEL